MVLEVVSKINWFTENTTQAKKIIGKGTVRSDATIRADIPYIYRLYRESRVHFLQGIDPLFFCTKYSKRQRLETSPNPLASKL
jgi:hypothetical protein